MNDYGLVYIAEKYSAVIVDSSALELHKPFKGSREAYDRIKDHVGKFGIAHSPHESIEYMIAVRDAFRRGFMVTSGVAEECGMRYRGLKRARDHDVGERARIEHEKSLQRLAMRHVIKLSENEETQRQKMRTYFSDFGDGVSETDFDLIITGLAIAVSRGSTAILTNDIPLMRRFKAIRRRVNSLEYLSSGLTYLANSLDAYVMVGGCGFQRVAPF